METIRTIFRTGNGPSSSHTMGPQRAGMIFLLRHPEITKVRVTLFGSLAATGHGHLTDKALGEVFHGRELEIVWEPSRSLPHHHNGMRFEIPGRENESTIWDVYSVGGGELIEAAPSGAGLRRIPYDFECETGSDKVYPDANATAILDSIEPRGLRFWDYILEHEEESIKEFLEQTWRTMRTTIERGIETEGLLPGGLLLSRKANAYFVKSKLYGNEFATVVRLFAYALATSEENAAGNLVVTAPTCGSCGVLPSVLLAIGESLDLAENQIISALGTAGLFGVIAKKNGSISGAEVGCQGEIGVACAMAAAAAAKLLGGTPRQIEYAAEIGLEHHLGLTCDPIGGLVQIPCIERNALAATTALASGHYAIVSDGRHQITYDEILETMLRTGKDLHSDYRETSTGGLAILQRRNICSK